MSNLNWNDSLNESIKHLNSSETNPGQLFELISSNEIISDHFEGPFGFKKSMRFFALFHLVYNIKYYFS